MTTILVDQTGNGDFTTIQAAVAAANSGDRILISGGTYTGPIDIQGKNLTLQSLNAGLDPANWSAANTVTTDRIISNASLTIAGIAVVGSTITSDGLYEGIEFDGGAANTLTVRNSTVSVSASNVPAANQQATGINIGYNTGAITLDHVKVSGFQGFTNSAVSSYAVYVNGSTDPTHTISITNSTLDTGTPRSIGLVFDGQVGGSQVNVQNNTFGAAGTAPGAVRVFDFGDVLTGTTDYSGIKNNTFTGAPGPVGQLSNETNLDGTGKGVEVAFGAANYTSGAHYDTVLNASDAATGQTLTGTSGANLLIGSAFNDTINGAAGSDVINGGAGIDRFVYAGGSDTISDFAPSQSDVIDLTAFRNIRSIAQVASRATQVGADTSIDFGNGNILKLSGVTASTLTNASFIFSQAPVALHDVNADGTSDVLLQSGGTVVDWIIKNGAYQTGNLVGNASGYNVVGSADFNGDGTADVLLQNGSTIVDWFLQNGTYQSGNVLGNAGAYQVVGTGDVNGDGFSDVLLQSGSSVIDWVVKNGAYQSGNVLANSSGYKVVGTGDFNGDGTSDVLLQLGNSVVDWTLKNGAYQSGNVLANSSGYQVVGTGDFNGDGTTDVLLQNGNSVIDWIVGNGAYQTGNVVGNSAGYSVVGTGDYNGDGTTDILLQNGSSVIQWTMQNGMYQSGNAVSNASGFTVKV